MALSAGATGKNRNQESQVLAINDTSQAWVEKGPEK